MEKITKFKAIDGAEFNNKNECLDYENLIERVNAIMSKLPKLPSNETDFVNGAGFIQHGKLDLILARLSLLKICKEYINHKWIDQTMYDETVHPSWVARLLGDYGIRPLQKAWDRFLCIDKQHREWGQPYFAANPDKGQQVRL